MHLVVSIPHDVTVNEPVKSTDAQYDASSFCLSDLSVRESRQKDKEERLSLVLWKRPITTLHYFLLETLIKLQEWTYE